MSHISTAEMLQLRELLQMKTNSVGLAIKKGWYKPYLAPEEQITETFKQAQWVLNANT